MKTIWILFLVHGGGYNGGNISVAQFDSEVSCRAAAKILTEAKFFRSAIDGAVCIDSGRSNER
jgi:hypothetical protein